MNWTLEPSDDGLVLRAGDELGIADLAGLHSALGRAATDDVRMIELDCSAVEQVDTAAVQWLLHLSRWCGDRGLALQWQGASEPVVALLALYRLQARLGLDAPHGG